MTTVDAEQLHRTAVVADTHNDLLMAVVARPPDRWGAYFRENWLPQLRDGGVDVQVLPVFVDDAYRPEGALRQTLRMIEAAHRLVEDNADEVTLCLDGAALDATLDSGRIALVLALEGCPGIDADVELFGDDAPPRGEDRLADPLRPHGAGRRQRRGRDRRTPHPRPVWPPSPRWSVSASSSMSPTSERRASSTCSSWPPGR